MKLSDTVPVDCAQLDRWEQAVNALRAELSAIQRYVTRGRSQEAKSVLANLYAQTSQLIVSLHVAGAGRHKSGSQCPIPLRQLSTPSNRRLHSALTRAHDAALEVDAERGHKNRRAAQVGEILESVSLEVYGPPDPYQT